MRHRLMMLIALLLAVLAAPAPVAAAEQHHVACVGQFGVTCKDANAYFSCGTTHQQIGETICAIRTPRGVQKYPFDTRTIDDVGGGECGIARVEVVCHGMPDDSQVEWHFDSCVAGREQMCRNYAHRYSCGTSRETIAVAQCGAAPFQTFSFYDAPGGRCGISLVGVGCHLPR